MKKSLAAATFLSLFLIMAGGAMADTFVWNGMGPGAAAVQVSIYESNEYIWAGMNQFTLGGGKYDGSYMGFCVDPAPMTAKSGQYFVVPVTDPQFMAAAYLLGNYSNNADMAAAVQLAIWELVFDFGDKYALDAGNFKYSGAYSSDIDKLILEASAAAGKGFDPSGYYLARSPEANPYGTSQQDFIFKASVPEPGTLALLGAGLLGLGLFSRKRRKG